MIVEKELEKLNELAGKFRKYYYRNIYDFILSEGKIFTSEKLTSNESDIVENAISNLEFYPMFKNCFYNSKMLSRADDSCSIKYCEGFARTPNIPMSFQHAWNSINGKLIDITYKTNSKGEFEEYSNFMLGEISKSFCYYGVEFPNKMSLNQEGSLIDDYVNDFPLLQKKYNS